MSKKSNRYKRRAEMLQRRERQHLMAQAALCDLISGGEVVSVRVELPNGTTLSLPSATLVAVRTKAGRHLTVRAISHHTNGEMAI